MVIHKDVNSTLLLELSETNCSRSFLYYCAEHFAQQGKNVLFISPTPMDSLPPTVSLNEGKKPSAAVYEKIRFMYSSNKQDLIAAMKSVFGQTQPATVILISHLESYGESAEHVAAALLNAVIVTAQLNDTDSIFMASYKTTCDSDKLNFLNNFTNIWAIEEGMDTVTIENLIETNSSGCPLVFQFSKDTTLNLKLVKAFKIIESGHDASPIQ